MINKVGNVKISLLEFFIKFPLVIFFIMPGCIGGFFWVGYQIDALLHIHILKLILPGIGSILGLYFTCLLVLFGHRKQQAAVS